jgi:hypothetical protein
LSIHLEALFLRSYSKPWFPEGMSVNDVNRVNPLYRFASCVPWIWKFKSECIYWNLWIFFFRVKRCDETQDLESNKKGHRGDKLSFLGSPDWIEISRRVQRR